MKIAFISDIHGNAVALEAVLEHIESKKVDKIVVLGDLCYRGPEPKRSLELIRLLACDVVKGNADEWVVRGIREGEVPHQALHMMRMEREWTLQQLTEDDICYLSMLPTELTIQLTDQLEIHAFHATPDSLFHIVPASSSDEELAQNMLVKASPQITLYAHIHFPYIRYVDGKCIGNLGSVGLPFDGQPLSSYMLVEGEGDQYELSIQRVKYDVEKVVQQLKQFSYPNASFLTDVLQTGRIAR